MTSGVGLEKSYDSHDGQYPEEEGFITCDIRTFRKMFSKGQEKLRNC